MNLAGNDIKYLKKLICFDFPSQELKDLCSSKGITIHGYHSLVTYERAMGENDIFEHT